MFATTRADRSRKVAKQLSKTSHGVPLMDSPLSINTKPMGEKLVEHLGRRPAVLLKAHGVVVVGADIV